MEYTVLKLAKMADISTRTLRYYDEIGLLKPQRINSSGYRIYGAKQVDDLQQILFFKSMGVELFEIKRIMADPLFDRENALLLHRENLLKQKRRIDAMIENIDCTIAAKKGDCIMSDEMKFAGLKDELIAENERKYGEEIREKYGEEAVKAANSKFRGMSKEDYERGQRLSQEIFQLLDEAFEAGGSDGNKSILLAEKHREWICLYWNSYSKEAHMGLVNMYVEDERFSAYYDRGTPGKAAFLRDAVTAYLQE